MSLMSLSPVNCSSTFSSQPLTNHSLVPAIIYIDKWGRRPMLLVGTFLMGFWMFFVATLQAQFGEWSDATLDQVFGSLQATRLQRKG